MCSESEERLETRVRMVRCLGSIPYGGWVEVSCLLSVVRCGEGGGLFMGWLIVEGIRLGAVAVLWWWAKEKGEWRSRGGFVSVIGNMISSFPQTSFRVWKKFTVLEFWLLKG